MARFDEVIAIKASKHSVYSLDEKLAKFIEQTQSCFGTAQDQIRSLNVLKEFVQQKIENQFEVLKKYEG